MHVPTDKSLEYNTYNEHRYIYGYENVWQNYGEYKLDLL